jgi:hypothetical protein
VDTFTASSATETEEGTQSQPTPSVSTVSFETPNTLTGAGDGLIEKGEDAHSHNKEISSSSGLTSPPVCVAYETRDRYVYTELCINIKFSGFG